MYLLRNLICFFGGIVSDYNTIDFMFEFCGFGKGYCPLYSKQALTTAYKAYHALGGNDVATDLYEKIMDMPEKETRNGEKGQEKN